MWRLLVALNPQHQLHSQHSPLLRNATHMHVNPINLSCPIQVAILLPDPSSCSVVVVFYLAEPPTVMHHELSNVCQSKKWTKKGTHVIRAYVCSDSACGPFVWMVHILTCKAVSSLVQPALDPRAAKAPKRWRWERKTWALQQWLWIAQCSTNEIV